MEVSTSRILIAYGVLLFAVPALAAPPDAVVSRSEGGVKSEAVSTVEGGATAEGSDADAFYGRARSHWSFHAPRLTGLPTVQQADWPRCDIDAFILARLEEKNLRPVGDANRRTLVRRLFFDLIGLPPSRREIESFLADRSPDAVPRLVDKLLASPGFGERWGRHWLDVVRFAESSGKEFNFTYPHAWPYRDYVIDSFNSDKPYDRFIQEQIAGDLLPAVEDESQEDFDARRIATSLLSFGPKRHNSGGKEFHLDVVDDQIDVTCRAILGLTASCARCHDHKFDPIPTDDYYALAGIFLSTEPLYGTVQQKYSNHPTDLIPIGSDAAVKHAAVQAHQARVDEVRKKLKGNRAEWKKEEARPQPGSSGAAPVTTADKLKSELESLEASLQELEQSFPPRPVYSQGSRDRSKPADTQVAIRGDPRQRGKTVPRGFLRVFDVAGARPVDPQSSGRAELAEWLTSPGNPLTARVMVNRIWHHLFGSGLVRTVDDFGTQGQPPSHPALLDTLALRFLRDGWSVKRMVRTIVLSRVYQLSSAPSAENHEIDPDSVFLWRMPVRRLEAEAIRDAVLAFSGQLVLQRPVGSTVTGLGDCLVRAVELEKLQPPSRHRSAYLAVVRDYAPELFDLFDFPSSSLVSGRRAATDVPAQALYLRNSDFVHAQAEHAARRLLASAITLKDEARIALAFERALGRPASAIERGAALRLVRQASAQQAENNQRDERQERGDDAGGRTQTRDPELAGWAALCRALVATVEFRYLVDVEESIQDQLVRR